MPNAGIRANESSLQEQQHLATISPPSKDLRCFSWSRVQHDGWGIWSLQTLPQMLPPKAGLGLCIYWESTDFGFKQKTGRTEESPYPFLPSAKTHAAIAFPTLHGTCQEYSNAQLKFLIWTDNEQFAQGANPAAQIVGFGTQHPLKYCVCMPNIGNNRPYQKNGCKNCHN